MYSLILVIKVKVGQVISVVPFPTKHENDQKTCLKVEKFCCEFIEPDEKKRKNFDDYFEFEESYHTWYRSDPFYDVSLHVVTINPFCNYANY